MNIPDLTTASVFVAASARVIDQRRFQRLFEDGPAAAVRDAVAAYRNDDGGFGHGLEPDCRSPAPEAAGLLAEAGQVLRKAGAEPSSSGSKLGRLLESLFRANSDEQDMLMA
jgi:hypothetical protein